MNNKDNPIKIFTDFILLTAVIFYVFGSAELMKIILDEESIVVGILTSAVTVPILVGLGFLFKEQKRKLFIGLCIYDLLLLIVIFLLSH